MPRTSMNSARLLNSVTACVITRSLSQTSGLQSGCRAGVAAGVISLAMIGLLFLCFMVFDEVVFHEAQSGDSGRQDQERSAMAALNLGCHPSLSDLEGGLKVPACTLLARIGNEIGAEDGRAERRAAGHCPGRGRQPVHLGHRRIKDAVVNV